MRNGSQSGLEKRETAEQAIAVSARNITGRNTNARDAPFFKRPESQIAAARPIGH
jgi:hypothetical protein